MNEARSPGPVIDGAAAAALMEPLTDLVIRAGAAILAVDRLAMRVDGKADGSPVTEADLAADRIIGEGLARLVPEIPVLSEERAGLAQPPYRGSFFLIDPLDGTKEFVAGRNEFTVNLALVTNGTPLLGIIGAPALGLIWRGLVGRGAERLTIRENASRLAEPIHTRKLAPRGNPWIAAVSRSHLDEKVRSLHRGATRRDPPGAGLGGQIRPGGGRCRRYLSPPRPHQRMGCRRRPRPRHRRRRQDHGCRRQGFAIRHRSARLYRSGIYRLGGS